MKRIHFLCVFLFLILCAAFVRAAAEEEVSIRFRFNQTSYHVGEEITAVYTITGGSGVYTDLQFYCIATDESSVMKLKCEHTPGADSSTGTIKYTPKDGDKTHIEISGYDSLAGFFMKSSGEIPLTGGTKADPIDVRFRFDKTSYRAGEEITVTYTITGGSGEYSSVEVFCHAFEGTSMIPVESEHLPGPGKATGIIRYTPVSGNETNVEINGMDSAGRVFSASSDHIPLTGGSAAKAIHVGIVFDKTSYRIGEEATVKYTVSGGNGSYPMITVFCKTTDGNSETVVKDYEHIPDPGRPAGTIRYTPLSGSATFVQISVFDSEGRFALETAGFKKQ